MSQDDREPPLAAIWGAAGFIGRHVAEALLRRGWRVRGLGRLRPDVATDWQRAYELRPLDFAAPDKVVAQALDGVACAIHCAGHYNGNASEFDSYVTSVRRFALAAKKQRLDRLLLLSSISIYGSDCTGVVGPDTAPRPETSYASSRWRAEQAACEVLATGPTRLVVLRVPSVVGTEMRSDVLRRFFRALRVGIFLHPGRVDAVFPCIGVHRLAECIVGAADSGPSMLPSVVQPVDCIPWVDLADHYGRAVGRRSIRIGLPAKTVQFVCRTLGYDIAHALKALDSAAHYEDNSRLLGIRYSLPQTTDDINALIGTLR